MSASLDNPAGGDAGHEAEQISAHFASLVTQNASMAMIFLGQAPHPQTGQVTQDLEHARYFIDQLEMLAVKTKGNLDKREAALLQQSLTHLRLGYVEAAAHPKPNDETEGPPTDEQERPTAEAAPEGEPGGDTAIISNRPEAGKAAEAETKKKFTKKY